MKHTLHSFFGRISTVRLNAELQRIFASGLRTQINAELPEWIQLAPYGEWPTSERNADGTPEAVQIFTREDGEALVKRFNAWHRRLTRLARLNSCKVYVGHPDFAPDIWPQRIELGDVVEVSADEHGLNGRIRWNSDAGELLKKNGFPSVAWDTEDVPQSPGRERPVMLWSIGMTARPNIKGVKSAINALPDSQEPETKKDEPPMIQKIKKALIDAGCAKEDDSDDVIQTHVGNLISQIGQSKQWAAQEKARGQRFNAALGIEVADVEAGIEACITRINAAAAEAVTLNERINALTAERDGKAADAAALQERCNAIATTRLNTAIDFLVETGRASKAEADATGNDGIRARLNADFDKAYGELRAKAPQLNTARVNVRTSKPAVMEANERRARINSWTEDYMARHSVGYDEAYKAAEADPELKPLFEAMKPPAE